LLVDVNAARDNALLTGDAVERTVDSMPESSRTLSRLYGGHRETQGYSHDSIA
jgi:hypothetical protein